MKLKPRYIKAEFGGFGWKDQSDPTGEQLRLVEVLAEWTCGTHHFQGSVSPDGRGIMLVTSRSGLSTFDCDRLTSLVLLAHKHLVRVEIEPKGFYLGISLHTRLPEGQGRRSFDTHPSLSDLRKRCLKLEKADDGYQCPFCSSSSIIVKSGTPDREGVPACVACDDCGASGPWVYIRPEQWDSCAQRDAIPAQALQRWIERKGV
jgi:hypothetical protein